MNSLNRVESLREVHVADLILIRHDDAEVLHQRRIYFNPAQAKSMRTRWTKWAKTYVGAPMGWGSQFKNFVATAYTITPDGYQDIP